MVTTEVSQLSKECNAWREELRSHRHQFNQLKNSLREIAGRQTHADVLREIEHLDNQFHIQLINIHDLKHCIKIHDRKMNTELAENKSQVSDETLSEHENLFDDFQRLEHTLHEIKQEFDYFVRQTR
jgi:uncharacterized protein (DUF2249 family)